MNYELICPVNNFKVECGMFDLHVLRHDFSLSMLSKKLARKGCILNMDIVQNKESKRRGLQIEIERLQSERKLKSKTIGFSKLKGENIESLCNEVKFLNHRLDKIKVAIKSLKYELKQYILSLPNIPDDTIPDGGAEKDNLEIFRWGIPKNHGFSILDHVELGQLIGGLDFLSGVKITGSRFVVMRGKIACLHRALSQFMLDVHIREHGYQEYYLPYLVNQNSLFGTGQLPKFSKDLFHIKSRKDEDKIYTLIPTSEVPLTNLVRDQILEEDRLPIKMVAHTPCFRSEAGTYGHDSRGLIRMHQFDKVELVQIVQPEQSMEVLEEMTTHAEKILQLLQLPYRKMLLSAGNIGFSSYKTYDLDVWFSACKAYREVSSCTNTKDFQARRMQARYRRKKDKKIKFLHTLNASGLAVGRTLAAILEYYQLPDGCVEIPSVLQSYMHGLTHITPS